MSLLLNKRKREESPINSKTITNYNLYQSDNKIENVYDENAYNKNNNNKDIFPQMFNSMNSRKDDETNPNNIIMSPISNSKIFYGSFQKSKIIEMANNSNENDKIYLNSSMQKDKTCYNNKNKLFSPSSYKLDKFRPINFVNKNLDIFNLSEGKNLFDLNSEHKDNVIDLFENKRQNFFDNIIFNENGKYQCVPPSVFSIQNEQNKQCIHSNNPINRSFLMAKIDDIENLDKNKKNKKLNSNILKKFQLFQTVRQKSYQKYSINYIKTKFQKPKIFHIEKVFNTKEYKEATEKEDNESVKNFINRFKISIKKIRQIYINSCLKIYSYVNKKYFDKTSLNDHFFIANVIKEVSDIINSKNINSSKMSEILQVTDDDKYRKHYFMFAPEAKQFCLDLINKNNFPFDVVMKMCKVPRKSLRRWLHVGCERKKGCGRKTKNPEMEERLVEWYRNELRNNKYVSAKIIRDKAVELSRDKDFMASKGWLEKFKKKYEIYIPTCKNQRNSLSINLMYSKSMTVEDKINCEINIVRNNSTL